ncbi:hypothetical protein [Psittacicella hinzii]|uniref:Uncharacterized protein n=1 Tax=Psittacicella hinzii TaxID=2028575 RepID=A0A3A1YMM1_9GAMM|nr:hypothetical protein [Psittacicella hinzii]RIY38508.1 hypothetical protein CKF58_04195 [Psittacicella hinzii]
MKKRNLTLTLLSLSLFFPSSALAIENSTKSTNLTLNTLSSVTASNYKFYYVATNYDKPVQRPEGVGKAPEVAAEGVGAVDTQNPGDGIQDLTNLSKKLGDGNTENNQGDNNTVTDPLQVPPAANTDNNSPAAPTTPTSPENPATLATPTNPETPASPETPATPATPASPETPAAPTTPATTDESKPATTPEQNSPNETNNGENSAPAEATEASAEGAASDENAENAEQTSPAVDENGNPLPAVEQPVLGVVQEATSTENLNGGAYYAKNFTFPEVNTLSVETNPDYKLQNNRVNNINPVPANPERDAMMADTVVVGVFANKDQAQQVAKASLQAGYSTTWDNMLDSFATPEQSLSDLARVNESLRLATNEANAKVAEAAVLAQAAGTLKDNPAYAFTTNYSGANEFRAFSVPVSPVNISGFWPNPAPMLNNYYYSNAGVALNNLDEHVINPYAALIKDFKPKVYGQGYYVNEFATVNPVYKVPLVEPIYTVEYTEGFNISNNNLTLEQTNLTLTDPNAENVEGTENTEVTPNVEDNNSTNEQTDNNTSPTTDNTPSTNPASPSENPNTTPVPPSTEPNNNPNSVPSTPSEQPTTPSAPTTPSTPETTPTTPTTPSSEPSPTARK